VSLLADTESRRPIDGEMVFLTPRIKGQRQLEDRGIGWTALGNVLEAKAESGLLDACHSGM